MFFLHLLLHIHLLWIAILPEYHSLKKMKNNTSCMCTLTTSVAPFKEDSFYTSNTLNTGYFITTAKDSLQIQKLKQKARTANRFGIAALVSLFIPLFNFISLPLAIVAIVKGIRIKKKLSLDELERKTANRAIIAGAITVFLVGVIVYFAIRLY